MSPFPIVDAVTAILDHEGEVFMARRNVQLAAFAGYQAFPGGKVDATDAEGVHAEVAATFGVDARLFCGLSRELMEELAFDLPAAVKDGLVQSCQLVGEAVTPSFVPFRFNTRFFLIRVTRKPDFTLDAREHLSSEWATPRAWLDRYDAGELLLAPPTLFALHALVDRSQPLTLDFGDFEDADTVPMVETLRGIRQFAVRSHTLPPARHTNCFLIGDAGAHRILIDPSPESREELERLWTTVEPLGFDEIFLTHHHPDHREFADELARRSGRPIGLSADTRERIAAEAPRFFKGVQTKIHTDGDVVSQWLGHAVRVIAVPGHDEGQLALMPDNRAWCLVGDLIQGIGTVVISAPEGNMAKYFASMQKIIDLAPRAIYPSHGTALGGTHYIEKTLAHRRQREKQVRELTEAGYSVEEILPVVYEGLHPGLVPLARRNIESHLMKLREEGALA